MIYVGCDVHKRNTKVIWLDDETGETTKPYQVATGELGEKLAEFAGRSRIAIEASSSGMFAARTLESLGHDVVLVDAFKTQRLLEALSSAKTDELDAEGLMVLLAKGMLDRAQVWIADEETMQLRELARTRDSLVRDSTKTRNQMRKLLSRHGHDCPFSDLGGEKAGHWLDDLQQRLPDDVAFCLEQMRAKLTFLQQSIDQFNQRLQARVEYNETVQLLMTIPGIGLVLAVVIAAEIGDINRFAAASKLRSYSRLTPRVDESAGRRIIGPLSKSGNRLLSWALIQAAGHFAASRHVRETRAYKQYQRVCFAHGCNPAKVSLARRLVDIIFAMLRDHKPFDLTLVQT